MISSKTKIGLLVAGHVVAGIALCLAAPTHTWPHPAVVGFLGVMFAEAGLLGVWAALGTTRPLIRFVIVPTAITYLWGVLVVSSQPPSRDELLLMLLLIVVPVAMIFLALSVLKWRRRLLVVRSATLSSSSEGLQFTIRHLLLITTIVAALLAIGRVFRSSSSPLMEFVAIVSVLGLCVAVLELAMLWATLCAGRPPIRLAIVLPLAFAAGVIPPYYLFFIHDSEMGARRMAIDVWPRIDHHRLLLVGRSILRLAAGAWRSK